MTEPRCLTPPPDLIIFDYDGVLCDAGLYTPDAIRDGLRRFGEAVGVAIPEPDEATLLATLGYPSHQTYPPLLPEPVRDQWRLMHAFTLDAMAERIEALGEGCLYPGVAALLDALVADGRRLGLASNSSARYQEVHRRAVGLDRWITHFQHAQAEGIASKADMVVRIRAAEPLARRPVVIGDRASDRDAAAACGLDYVACRYGYGRPDEWAGAVALVDTPAELGAVLGLR